MSTESVGAPVALVAGGDNGTGLEAPRSLAGAGNRFHLTACGSQLGRTTAATAGAQFLELDIDESVRHAADCVERAGRHLDVLVNNAGITGPVGDDERRHRRRHDRSGRTFTP